ncbi:hypothetical protein SAMN04488519_103258 [Algoriphagus ornithinivorans]|uniref:Uncharacterized protein n=1 Tax=Algoriphagus ornithinivorans TaxID=226506 RepID=A0A1I5E3C9_9BACT|nr:DUF6090 family protein [Algoriphagus ornithinivorans]SFO05661.1 hypothetical protein SAMN04488519_103258 [Algoriphagus ornithinivorans]
MINFFRKIRQNLLSEGKTGKYLKYAIGEIVLVVIGILIALQINNWNQQRILEKQSQQVLLNLREEIKENKTELESAIEFLKQRVDRRIEYLNSSDQNISDSEKIKKISTMVFFYLERIELPIIENELGPNKKIFQWSELTKSMQNLSESIGYYNKGIEYLENDVHSNILPYLVDQGVMTDIMVSNGILNSKDYLNVDVYNSENFRNVIASSTVMTSALLEGANKVIKNYNELLLIINQRIE